MKKCLLISFFNSHNIGDRLIALSLTNRYQSFYKVIKCSFEGSLDIWPENSYRYGIKDEVKRVYGNCLSFLQKLYHRSRKEDVSLDQSIMYEIETCDVVYIGGGNMLMYDYYLMFKSYLEYAKECEKPVFAVDIGVGPFSNENELKNTCKYLDMCQSVTFRDKSSLALAKKYCVNDKLFLAVDPCFSLYKNRIGRVEQGEKDVVAINMMDLRLDFATKEMQRTLLDRYESVIKNIAKITRKKIVLYSTVYEDYFVIRKLAKRLVRNNTDIEIRTVYTMDDLDNLYQKTCYVIAMRMHALILAYAYGIPHCGIAWQKKVDSFFEITKQNDNCFSVQDLEKNIPRIVSTFAKAQEKGFQVINTSKEIMDLEKVDLRIISNNIEVRI